MSEIARWVLTMALAIVTTLLLASCDEDPGLSDEPEPISRSEVEEWLEAEYYGTNDPAPQEVEVDCPGSLDREAGADLRCEMTRGDLYYEVEVTVMALDGDEVEWESEIVQRRY